MKKLFMMLSASLVLFSTACNKDAEAHYFGEYADLKPGMAIYNAAATQQLVSLDPAAVAIRLAMLLDEAAEQNLPIEEVQVHISPRDYLLKELLFGREVGIETVEGTEEEPAEPGLYRITYVHAAPASIDTYRREGSYLIRTHGLSLTESSADMPWVVMPEELLYLNSGNSDSERFVITGGAIRLHAAGAGIYAIGLDGLKASFEVSERFASAWSGDFFFTTSTTTGTLAYSNHDEDTFALWGEAEGPTFYAFNNSSTTRMRYTVGESNRLSWAPAETRSFTVAKGGTEQCRLTHSEDYQVELYPSSEVTVSRTYAEGEVTRTLSYNGLTMQF